MALSNCPPLPAGAQNACLQARELVTAMRATLRGCEVDGLDVTVSVSAGTGLRVGGRAHAAARAGPVEPG